MTVNGAVRPPACANSGSASMASAALANRAQQAAVGERPDPRSAREANAVEAFSRGHRAPIRGSVPARRRAMLAWWRQTIQAEISGIGQG